MDETYHRAVTDPSLEGQTATMSSPGVLVIGMHRSGTSAVARALHLLGLRTPAGQDLMGPDASNPTGYFESRSMRFVNDELLLSLGGTWSAPPPLEPGWEREPIASSLVDRATETFLRAYPEGPWVWKDPRTSITLPFWDRVLTLRPVVAVFRHPLEVVRSLEARDEHHRSLALALWFRYTRAMLRNAEGHPAYVTDWARVREDPVAWCGAVGDWLSEQDLPVPEGGVKRAAEAIEPSLSPVLPGGEHDEADAPLAGEDRVLLERLRAVEGPHRRLPAVEVPAEPAGRAALLEERRTLEVATLHRLGGAAQERETLEDYVRMLEHELERKNALIERFRGRDPGRSDGSSGPEASPSPPASEAQAQESQGRGESPPGLGR